MKHRNSWIAGLREIALFSACTDKELELIGSATTRLTFDAGTVMARQGSRGHELITIVEGQANVEIDGQRIATLGDGDFFGEIALLDGGPRTASVVAETPVVAEVIGEREFTGLVERTPNLARNLLRGLAGRLRAADLQLVA